jgi:N-acetylglucosamine-6-sulfatase
MPRLLVLLLLALLSVPATASAGPNVVVIETDDQTVPDMAAMPRTRALIGAEGTTFANSFVSLSECCPSRATFLTGQYAHNHGVLSIGPPLGGFSRLHGSETLPVWLRRAGYRTALIGKYLNGYQGTRVPPGWTDFEGLLSRFTYRFFDYRMNVNGHIEHHGYAPRDFQTDLITRRSLRFIGSQRARPFFLWATYVAPHIGRPHDFTDPLGLNSAVPAERDGLAFLGAPLPRPPSFQEADVSDKPPAIRKRPPLKPWQLWALEQTHRQRLASLVAVDEGVARIVAALRARGELSDTLLIFTSDNGFMLGEHRVLTGKILPYEPSIRVPLMMRGPGVPHGVRRDLVWNGDLAPTILDAAGARPAFPLDGRSLLAPPRPHRDIVLEGPPGPHTNGLPRFLGLRTPRYKYVEYLGGARELYDLRRDPDETRNLARAPATARLRANLRQRLARLAGCAGAACR